MDGIQGIQGLQEAYDRAYDLWVDAGNKYSAGEIEIASDLYAEALEIGLDVMEEENVVELCRDLTLCCNQAQRYDDAAKYGWKTLVRLERGNSGTRPEPPQVVSTIPMPGISSPEESILPVQNCMMLQQPCDAPQVPKAPSITPDRRQNVIQMRYVLASGLSGTESGRRFRVERFEDARSLFSQNIDSLLKGDKDHDQLTETSRKTLLRENREGLAAVFFNLAENSGDEIMAKDFYRQSGSLWEEVMSARAGDPVTVVQSLKAKDYYARCLLHQEKYESGLAQLLDLRTRLDQLDLHQFKPDVHNDLEQIRQISIISTVDARRALQRLAEKNAVGSQTHEQPIGNQEALNKAARLTVNMEAKEGTPKASGGWNFWPSAFRSQTVENSASSASVTTAPGTFPVEDECTAEANIHRSHAITTEDLPARVLNNERPTTPLTPPENIQRSKSANGPVNHSQSMAQAAFAPVHAPGTHSNNTVSGDARAHFGNSFAQNSTQTFNFFTLSPDQLAQALKGTLPSGSIPPQPPP